MLTQANKGSRFSYPYTRKLTCKLTDLVAWQPRGLLYGSMIFPTLVAYCVIIITADGELTSLDSSRISLLTLTPPTTHFQKINVQNECKKYYFSVACWHHNNSHFFRTEKIPLSQKYTTLSPLMKVIISQNKRHRVQDRALTGPQKARQLTRSY